MPRIDSSFLPGIFEATASARDIITGIKNGRLFGFVFCDLKSTSKTTTKWHDFPPCLTRLTLTDEHLTPEMKNQVSLEKPGAKFNRTSLVQCFNAKSQVIMTPLARFYMDQGIDLVNITGFVQYVPFRSLNPFADHVTGSGFLNEKI